MKQFNNGYTIVSIKPKGGLSLNSILADIKATLPAKLAPSYTSEKGRLFVGITVNIKDEGFKNLSHFRFLLSEADLNQWFSDIEDAAHSYGQEPHIVSAQFKYKLTALDNYDLKNHMAAVARMEGYNPNLKPSQYPGSWDYKNWPLAGPLPGNSFTYNKMLFRFFKKDDEVSRIFIVQQIDLKLNVLDTFVDEVDFDHIKVTGTFTRVHKGIHHHFVDGVLAASSTGPLEVTTSDFRIDL